MTVPTLRFNSVGITRTLGLGPGCAGWPHPYFGSFDPVPAFPSAVGWTLGCSAGPPTGSLGAVSGHGALACAAVEATLGGRPAAWPRAHQRSRLCRGLLLRSSPTFTFRPIPLEPLA